jgi:hypothetical protein
MVSLLASSVVDRGLSHAGQTIDYKICLCCFSAKNTALRRNKEINIEQDRRPRSISY